MNPFRIRAGEVFTFTVPLKDPFVTALGSKTETTNAAIRLTLAGGARGCGEASSSVVMKHLSAEALARALRRLLARLKGRDVRESEPLARDIWRLCPETPAAAAAFECAALEALTDALGVRMAHWFGGAQDRLETDLTLSAWPAPQAGAAAGKALRAGFRCLKIKVGTKDQDADLERVRAVVLAGRRLGKRPELILDGNQGFTAEGALRFLERSLKLGAKAVLCEQPLPREKLQEAAWLSKRSPVPLAADESVRSPEDALAVLEAGAAEVFNLKVAKLGIRRSLDVAALARASGKRLMIGCMQETARGLSPSVHLACGLGGFSFVDLDSDALLADSQPRGDFRRKGRTLTLS